MQRLRNSEIKEQMRAIRNHAQRVLEEISMIEVGLSMLPPDEVFTDGTLRDRITDITMGVQNLNGEVAIMWRRTR